MEKTLQELNLENDFLFSKVMSDQDVCKSVLEKILKLQIDHVEVPELQKTIDILLNSKGIRLDVYAQDEKNTIYNVEMQRGRKRNLPKRTRYYQGTIDMDLISKGEPYEKQNKTFIIFICTFDYWNKGRHIYTFENVCKEDSSLFLGDEVQKIILNTKGTEPDVDDEMLEFLQYVEDSTAQKAEQSHGKLVKQVHTKVEEVKHSEEMEVEYMTLLERDREKIEEGIEQGKIATKEEVARNLLDILDVESIAERVGLPKERVMCLREEAKYESMQKKEVDL